MKINEKIKARRLELGLTLQEVADKVGVDKSTVFFWEKGRTSKMKLDYLLALAKALRVDASSLMFEELDMKELPINEVYSPQELDQELIKLVLALSLKEKVELFDKLCKESR